MSYKDIIKFKKIRKRNRLRSSSFYGVSSSEYNFNFANKIAGSIAECPLKLYRCEMTTQQNPNNITGNVLTGYAEVMLQADLDVVKTQNGVSLTKSTTVNNAMEQYLIEVDLTALATSKGGNAALKSAIKNIICDGIGLASGSNGGSIAYSCRARIWNGASWSVGSGATDNNINSLASMQVKTNDNAISSPCINVSNKLFVLVFSEYNSNGTISNTLSLDYINIKILF